MRASESVNNQPRSPYHQMCEAEVRKAMNTRYIDGDASDFFFSCSNGDIDKVRKILEAPDRKPIDELVKLERNGDTALHVATEKEHIEIVKLLLEHGCSRTILNRTGKVASEIATTPVMQRLFIRSEASGRFHEPNPSKTMVHFLPKENKTDTTSNEPNMASNGTNTTSNGTNTTSNGTNTTSNGTNTTSNGTNTTSNGANTTSNGALQFFQEFETEEEVYRYSLNHQTMAMWLKFFNWVSRTFPILFQSENLNLHTFELHMNPDFQYFLQEKLGEKYPETFEEFNKAQEKNSIEPLLKIYSSEKHGFYRPLNRQLADSPAEADTSPHLCDRFIIEFHIRSDELEKRAFIGTAYRGATIDLSDLSLYEKICNNKPRGIIAFKAFTSTSEDKDIALQFIINNPPQNHQIGVLFVIETTVKSPTIVGIANVSEFKHEKEILFMPDNLFIVKKIEKDVVTYNRAQHCLTLTEIHLEYLHIPVSFRKKLMHTYRSAVENTFT